VAITVRSSRDIIDFVNSHPTGTRRTRILALVALGGIFVDAYDFTSLGLGLHSLTGQWKLTAFEVGALTSIMAAGALIGALCGGYIVDRVGRYKLFVIDLVLFVVAAIAAGLAPDLAVLLICRFLLGFGVGLDMPASFSFITEFTATPDKGKYVNSWQAMWYVAVVSAGVILLPFYLGGAGQDLWRWAVGLGALPALVVLTLRLIYTEESPMWAAHCLGLAEAGRILERSYGITVTVAPAGDPGGPGAPGGPDAPGESGQARARPARARGLPGLTATRTLFSRRYLSRTVASSAITMTQATQYYAVGFYIPTISLLILGAGTLQAIVGTSLINVAGIVGGTIQAYLTRRLGLRRLAMAGYVLVCACAVTLGLMGGHGGYAAAGLIAAFIFGQSAGPGPQGKTMAALSYPTPLRGAATGWNEAMSRVGTIVGFYLFPTLLSAVGLGATMLYVAIVPAIGFAVLLVIRWDPIGKDVENEEPGVGVAAHLAAR